MNYIRSGWIEMRFLIFFLLLLSGQAMILGVETETLNIYIDQTRLWDNKLNTVFSIPFKIPYGELGFEQKEYGWQADLAVTLSIKRDEKILASKTFDHGIVVSSVQRT
ncbi:MAG: hypothetical protein K8S56_04160, partial [Candidatus Cloacimonetes bacterium]|nr:hypothetical protein [Candidatus Cloacimonadota bacterium]